jgi:DNA-binding transcriptional MerR regulator
MNKAAEAFRTIGEVAGDLDVPKHVLRFWEGKFPQIRPMKRGGGRRYYRPEDMELLRGIRHLLHAEGYTIKGVQKILREQGVDEVKAASRAALAATGTERGAKKRGRKAIAVAPVRKDAAAVEAAPAPAVAVKVAVAPAIKAVIAAAIRELELCRSILAATAPRAVAESSEPKQARAGRP